MGTYTTVEDTVSKHYTVQTESLIRDCIKIRSNESEYLPWNNPDNIVSQDVERIARRIKDLTLAVAIMVGGPANIINMAVFYKQGLQDRVNLCLFMLAFFDDMFITSAFGLHAQNIYSSHSVHSPGNQDMANHNLVVFMGSAFLSFIMSAIIACERCYCVLRPLKYQTLMRTRTMALIILCFAVFVFSVFFVVSYRYWIWCYYDPLTGEEVIKIAGGEFYRAHKQLIDYLDSVLFGAGVPGGVMIVVISTTVITTAKLRHIVTWRSETSSALSAREVALTKMLVGNSVFFITCTTPSCIFRVVCLFLPEMSAVGRNQNFYFTTLWTLEGFCFINSSCNVFIYYVMGSRYRETLRGLCCRKKVLQNKTNN
ncbi:uncharacterized protein LOC143289688 [Babylonia areolata]|uniref:uncharacterized protein LOC143289688 n=1 Tax=Babylonia areolata TaxID=304850 RepID=UPI003FD18E4E